MCQGLDETDFNDVYACTKPENAYSLFYTKLMKAYDKYLYKYAHLIIFTCILRNINVKLLLLLLILTSCDHVRQ